MIFNSTLPKQPEIIGTGQHSVKYHDYKGKVIRIHLVDTGENARPPIPPQLNEHEFQGWNDPAENVQKDLDIGPMYRPLDGKTRFEIHVTKLSGNDLVLHLNNTSGELNVDFGDGSPVEQYSDNGNFTTGTHTYPGVGVYIGKLWKTGGAEGSPYRLGGGSAATSFCGGSVQAQRDMLWSINFCGRVTGTGWDTFQDHRNLSAISFSKNLTSGIGRYAFVGCRRLQFLSYPSDMTGNFQPYEYVNCHQLKGISMASSVGMNGLPAGLLINCYNISTLSFIQQVAGAIEAEAMSNCYNAERIHFKQGITSIAANAFANCRAVKEYFFEDTTPPALENVNAFSGISSGCKIYVPTAAIGDYLAAANWSTFSNYIYTKDF
jgi:hypothetical protein